MKFEYWRNFWRKWNYRLVAANGKVMMQSTQGHNNKEDMMSSISSIKKNLGDSSRIVPVIEIKN